MIKMLTYHYSSAKPELLSKTEIFGPIAHILILNSLCKRQALFAVQILSHTNRKGYLSAAYLPNTFEK